jgi:hypothetical protein
MNGLYIVTIREQEYIIYPTHLLHGLDAQQQLGRHVLRQTAGGQVVAVVAVQSLA